jgi:hypothetical protein
LETAIIPSVRPSTQTPREVAAEFRALARGGAAVRPAGEARDDPQRLLKGYAPRFKLELFDTTIYLARLRQNETFRFFVSYLRPPRSRILFPRLFYKDSSLVWRCATHYILNPDELWIGKGALKPVPGDPEGSWASAEETTNLPLELQAALDDLSRRDPRIPTDYRAVPLVLRRAPDDRLDAYRDFSAPRERDWANPRNRINGDKEVAWFERPGDPASLRFAAGFETDLAGGRLEESSIKSTLYGGPVRKLRFLSTNRLIQYQFMAAPRLVWIIPPQTLTTELSSFGVRTIDVEHAEDLCVPGYEYHYMDETEDPPVLHSQIPPGFVGQQSEVDPMRADAAPWLEKLPVIREFRRRGL